MIVLNGDEAEGKRVAADYDKDHKVWTGNQQDTPNAWFDIRGARASLRLKGARTECLNADKTKHLTKEDEWMAYFAFACNSEEVRKVSFRTDPKSIPVGYVRRLSAGAGSCTEWAYYKDGRRTISDVRTDSETLVLQIGWTIEDHDAPGLDFDDVMKVIGRAEGGASVQLTRDHIVYVLSVRRVKGTGESSPTTSSVAIDLDRLKVNNLKTLTLTVE